MPDSGSAIEITGPSTVEDIMAALAKQSIFDLPSLVRDIVKTTQEHAEEEDEPVVWDFFIHDTYVLQHVQRPAVIEEGGGEPTNPTG